MVSIECFHYSNGYHSYIVIGQSLHLMTATYHQPPTTNHNHQIDTVNIRWPRVITGRWCMSPRQQRVGWISAHEPLGKRKALVRSDRSCCRSWERERERLKVENRVDGWPDLGQGRCLRWWWLVCCLAWLSSSQYMSVYPSSSIVYYSWDTIKLVTVECRIYDSLTYWRMCSL